MIDILLIGFLMILFAKDAVATFIGASIYGLIAFELVAEVLHTI